MVVLHSPLRSPLRSPLYSPLVGKSGGASAPPDLLPQVLAMFANGNIGAVIDLSNPSKNFTTSAGSTNVAAMGDPIGRSVDQTANAKNATQATTSARPLFFGNPKRLGPELVTNGRMATDSDWTKGAGWTIAAGLASKSAGTASSLTEVIAPTMTLVQLTYSLRWTAGTVTPRLVGGTTVSGLSRNYAGSYIEFLLVPAGAVTIDFLGDAAFVGAVGNVSARDVLEASDIGGLGDGANDALITPAIDLSAGQKLTLVISGRRPQDLINTFNGAFGNINSFAGSLAYGQINGPISGQLRGATGQITVMMTGDLLRYLYTYVQTLEIDLSEPVAADQVKLRSRGQALTQSLTAGTSTGGGNLANTVLTLFGAGNGSLFMKGLLNRAVLINRELTDAEKVVAEKWARGNRVYMAMLGDSTTGEIGGAQGGDFFRYPLSSLMPEAITGSAFLSTSGEKIADQKARWVALAGKDNLEAVTIQIGLNDIWNYIGTGVRTATQIIGDLQDLVNSVNSLKPVGCKTYICALTPCRGWLALSGSPSNAYQGWLDINDAIAGNGPTPITGVDRRITSHVALLNDGNGYLQEIYDSNPDGVHENTEGMINCIVPAYRAALVADGLIA